MRVFPINDHLISFYDGRPPEAARRPDAHNWADYGALDVGVSTYVIHRGDQALVYDTFPTAAEAIRFAIEEMPPTSVDHNGFPSSAFRA